MKEGSGRAFTVEIRREGDHYVGRLRGAQVSGAASARSFEDADCAEVASSLSLVLALAIDPQAALALPLSGKETPQSSSKAKPRPASKPNPRPTPQPERRREPVQPPTRRRASTAPVKTARLVRYDAGALAFVRSGIAPKALVGAGLALRVRLAGRGTIRGPSFALQGLAAQTGLVGPQAPDAKYRWLAARALVAPVSLRPSTATLVLPSLVADFGAVTGTGRSVASPETDTGFWASAGVGIVFGASLGQRLLLDASLNVQANLQRHRFVFQRPFRVVYKIPAASLGASLGLSWQL